MTRPHDSNDVIIETCIDEYLASLDRQLSCLDADERSEVVEQIQLGLRERIVDVGKRAAFEDADITQVIDVAFREANKPQTIGRSYRRIDPNSMAVLYAGIGAHAVLVPLLIDTWYPVNLALALTQIVGIATLLVFPAIVGWYLGMVVHNSKIQSRLQQELRSTVFSAAALVCVSGALFCIVAARSTSWVLPSAHTWLMKQSILDFHAALPSTEVMLNAWMSASLLSLATMICLAIVSAEVNLHKPVLAR